MLVFVTNSKFAAVGFDMVAQCDILGCDSTILVVLSNICFVTSALPGEAVSRNL